MGEKISFIDLFGTELELEDEYAREQLSNESAARAEDVAVLEARMDTFTALPAGSTSGDAELMDIRVGADGMTYASAGSAVREQNNKLQKRINYTTNMYRQELFGGEYDTVILDAQNTLTHDPYAKSGTCEIYGFSTIKIKASGDFNRFIVIGHNSLEAGTPGVKLYQVPNPTVNNFTYQSYVYENTGEYKYLTVVVQYARSTNVNLSIRADNFDENNDFFVNGIPTYTKGQANDHTLSAINETRQVYFETVNENLFNPETVTVDYSVSSSDGQLVQLPGYTTSDFIPITPNTSYTFSLRHTVAFYDGDKKYISGSPSSASSESTLTSPETAKYLRFAYNRHYIQGIQIRVNEGDTLLPYEPYGGYIQSEHIEKKYKLVCDTIKNFKGFSNETSNFCLIGSKLIYGDIPEYDGFLLLDETTNKLYYADGQLQEISYLCDWDLTLSNNVVCADYLATITADGDIIFLRKWKRENPIIYPHGDYSNPYVVDFGTGLPPYGFLTGVSCVQFSDGSFVFGDYAKHSLENEQNNDPRNIWRVVKPYNNPSNWTVAHSFKHVFYESPVSDEPDNEIGHIHTVSYDFYNDDLYCTTGDIDRHCRVWKSTDKGETWAEVVSNGQKYRSVGIVFNEQGCWYGTDSFYGDHNLWLAPRLQTGECDFVNIKKIVLLEPIGRNGSQATYGTILLKEPNGLLFMDRAEPREDNLLDIPFYSFDDEKLYFIATYKKVIFGTVEPNRNGLCNQFFTEYQPTTTDFVLTGGGSIVRPNTDDVLNNASDNYIGLVKMRVVCD